MNELNNNFIVFGKGAGWINALFADIDNDDHFVIGNDQFCPCWQTKLSNVLCRLAFGGRYGNPNSTNTFAKKLIKKMCTSVSKRFPNGAICIFHRSSPLAHHSLFLTTFKKLNPKSTLVYWFEDLVDAVKINFPQITDFCKNYYDYVVSYEKEDAEKYNYIYLHEPYSYKKYARNANVSKEIDILFVGKAKIESDPSRFPKIIKIYKEAIKNNLNVKFIIPDVPKEKQVFANHIIYDTYLPYRDVIKLVQNSKGVLEVAQTGAKQGTTLRLFESIAFNAKLLFTNEGMKNHILYDERMMLFIDTNNLDFSSLKKDFLDIPATADTSKLEPYSPAVFLNTLNELISERSRKND